MESGNCLRWKCARERAVRAGAAYREVYGDSVHSFQGCFKRAERPRPSPQDRIPSLFGVEGCSSSSGIGFVFWDYLYPAACPSTEVKFNETFHLQPYFELYE